MSCDGDDRDVHGACHVGVMKSSLHGEYLFPISVFGGGFVPRDAHDACHGRGGETLPPPRWLQQPFLSPLPGQLPFQSEDHSTILTNFRLCLG